MKKVELTQQQLCKLLCEKYGIDTKGANLMTGISTNAPVHISDVKFAIEGTSLMDAIYSLYDERRSNESNIIQYLNDLNTSGLLCNLKPEQYKDFIAWLKTIPTDEVILGENKEEMMRLFGKLIEVSFNNYNKIVSKLKEIGFKDMLCINDIHIQEKMLEFLRELYAEGFDEKHGCGSEFKPTALEEEIRALTDQLIKRDGGYSNVIADKIRSMGFEAFDLLFELGDTEQQEEVLRFLKLLQAGKPYKNQAGDFCGPHDEVPCANTKDLSLDEWIILLGCGKEPVLPENYVEEIQGWLSRLDRPQIDLDHCSPIKVDVPGGIFGKVTLFELRDSESKELERQRKIAKLDMLLGELKTFVNEL